MQALEIAQRAQHAQEQIQAGAPLPPLFPPRGAASAAERVDQPQRAAPRADTAGAPPPPLQQATPPRQRLRPDVPFQGGMPELRSPDSDHEVPTRATSVLAAHAVADEDQEAPGGDAGGDVDAEPSLAHHHHHEARASDVRPDARPRPRRQDRASPRPPTQPSCTRARSRVEQTDGPAGSVASGGDDVCGAQRESAACADSVSPRALRGAVKTQDPSPAPRPRTAQVSGVVELAAAMVGSEAAVTEGTDGVQSPEWRASPSPHHSRGRVSAGAAVRVDAEPSGRGLADVAAAGDEADEHKPWSDAPPAPSATLMHDAVRSAAAQEEYRRLMESIVAPLAMGGIGTAEGLPAGGDVASGAQPDRPEAAHSVGGGVGLGGKGGEAGGYAARYLQQRKGSEVGIGYAGAAAARHGVVADAAANVDVAGGGHRMRVSPPRLGVDPVGSTGAQVGSVGVHTHPAGAGGGPGHGLGHSFGSGLASPGQDTGVRIQGEDRWAGVHGGWGGRSRSLSPGAPIGHSDMHVRDASPGAVSVEAAGCARPCPPPAVAAAACSYSISNACSVRPPGPASAVMCTDPEVRHVRPQSAGACMHGRSHVGCLDARRPSPVVGAAGAAVPDVRELLTQREALLEALERERRELVATRQRAQEAEADLQECSMTYEVRPPLSSAESHRFRRSLLLQCQAHLSATHLSATPLSAWCQSRSILFHSGFGIDCVCATTDKNSGAASGAWVEQCARNVRSMKPCSLRMV